MTNEQIILTDKILHKLWFMILIYSYLIHPIIYTIIWNKHVKETYQFFILLDPLYPNIPCFFHGLEKMPSILFLLPIFTISKESPFFWSIAKLHYLLIVYNYRVQVMMRKVIDAQINNRISVNRFISTEKLTLLISPFIIKRIWCP